MPNLVTTLFCALFSTPLNNKLDFVLFLFEDSLTVEDNDAFAFLFNCASIGLSFFNSKICLLDLISSSSCSFGLNCTVVEAVVVVFVVETVVVAVVVVVVDVVVVVVVVVVVNVDFGVDFVVEEVSVFKSLALFKISLLFFPDLRT